MVDTSLSFYDGAFWDGKLYFSNRPYNGLFCADVTTGATEYLGRFPGEPRSAQALHKRVVADAGKLYFFPGYGHAIDVYSLEERSFSSIPVDRKGKEYTAEIVQVGRDVWILPVFTDQDVQILHLDTGIVDVEPAFSAFFRAQGIRPETFLLVRASYHDGKIWFALFDTDRVASWDVEKRKGEIISVGVPHLFSLSVLKGQFFLLDNGKTDVVQWNPVTGQKETLRDEMFPEPDVAWGRPYNRIVDFQGTLLLLPAFSSKLRKIDAEAGTLSVLWNLPVSQWYFELPVCFMGKAHGNTWYGFPFYGAFLYVLEADGSRRATQLYLKQPQILDEVRNDIRMEQAASWCPGVESDPLYYAPKEDLDEHIETDAFSFMHLETMIEAEGRRYFLTKDFDGLFCSAPGRELHAKKMCSFVGGKRADRLFGNLLEQDGKIYCAPFHSSRIAVYDVHTEELTYISVPRPNQSPEKFQFGRSMFLGMVSYAGCIYFIGANYPGIIRLNPATNDVHCFDGWEEEAEQHAQHPAWMYFGRSFVCLKDGTLYLPSCSSAGVLEVQLSTMESHWHWMPESGVTGFDAIYQINGGFWLASSFRDFILAWNPADDATERVRLQEKQTYDEVSTSCNGVADGTKIYLLDQIDDQMLVFDTETKKTVRWPIPINKALSPVYPMTKFSFAVKLKQKIVVGIQFWNNPCWEFSLSKGELRPVTAVCRR